MKNTAIGYKRKLNTGGQIGSGLGAAAGAAFIPIPGVGSMIGERIGNFIGSKFDKNKDPRIPMLTANATQGYRKGGKLPKYPLGGSMSAVPIGDDAVRYDGPSHEQGGIPIDNQGAPNPMNPTAEVEGGETRQGDFIFSDEIMVPESDMTFAQAHEMLLEQGAGEEEIDQLAQMQEQVKAEQGIGDGPMMRDGGNVNKFYPNQLRNPHYENSNIPYRMPSNSDGNTQYNHLGRHRSLKNPSYSMTGQLADVNDDFMGSIDLRNNDFSHRMSNPPNLGHKPSWLPDDYAEQMRNPEFKLMDYNSIGGQSDWTEPTKSNNKSKSKVNNQKPSWLQEQHDRDEFERNPYGLRQAQGETTDRATWNKQNRNPKEAPKMNTAVSIVDYLNSKGEGSSFDRRKKLAKIHGIEDYKGTAAQNTQLLHKLNEIEERGIGYASSNVNPQRQTNRPATQDREVTLPPIRKAMKTGGHLPKYGGGGNYLDDGTYVGNYDYGNGNPNLVRPKAQATPLVDSAPKKEFDYLGTAQRILPSIVGIGATLLSKAPEATRKVSAERITPDRGIFTDARRNIQAGARANPQSQGAYAQATGALNQTAAQEGQYLNQIEHVNLTNKLRADSMNAQIEQQNNQNLAQHRGAKISGIANAITNPLDQYAQDAADERSNLRDILISGNRIQNATDRERTQIFNMKALGYSDEKIMNLLRRRRYGGKINSKR